MWCEQGATFSLSITWTNPDGTPINITGASAKMQVRATKTSSNVILEASTTNGRITLGGSAGTVIFNIPASVTSLLSVGQYVYDLNITDSSGNITRLLEGAFFVDGEVTK